MTLVSQDKNLIVTYIQIYLSENFGLSVRKVDSNFNQVLNANIEQTLLPKYEITADDPIEVTGYLTPQTYSSMALYMMQNYPNERFPVAWILTEDGWESTDKFYDSYMDNWRNVLLTPPDWDDIANQIIGTNMDNYDINSHSIEIPERVISYIMGEVVSNSSTYEEVLRIKKLLLDSDYDPEVFGFMDNSSLDYNETLQHIICRIQSRFLEKYPSPPIQFKDFKITGYVDPWTELIIERGMY